MSTPGISASYQLFPPFDKIHIPNNKIRLLDENYQLTADKLLIEDHMVRVIGDVHYQHKDMQLIADEALVDKSNKKIILKNTHYIFNKNHLNGVSEKMLLLSYVSSNIESASISTCPINQAINEAQDWHMEAQNIKIDYVHGWMEASELYFFIGKIPIMYLPILNFPIDKRRKSGLLYPSIGSNNIDGVNIYLPFYWNIKHNSDYQGVVNLIENRGLWMSHKLQFLSPNTISSVHIESIVNDKITKTDRNLLSIQQKMLTISRWYYKIDFNQASDIDYLQDFTSKLYNHDTEYLNQMAFIRYKQNTWSLQMKLLKFQPLFTSDHKKYQLTPEIILNWKILDFLNIQLDNTNFQSLTDDNSSGNRMILELNTQKTTTKNYFKNTTGLNFKYINYSALKNIDNVLDNDIVYNQATTFFSDNQLFLERDLNDAWTQTLEPRLYYAKRNQPDDNTPLFDSDSDPIALSYNNLFNYNRYNGKDRIGALDRLSLGISSRFIQNGNTILILDLAKAYNFDTNKTTNMITKTTLNQDSWQFNSGLELDGGMVTKNTSSINYQIDTKKLINLTYKTDTKTMLNEIKLTTRFALNHKWQLFANLKQTNNASTDYTIGASYETCCWEILLSSEHRTKNLNNLNQDTIEYVNKFYITLGIKGVSSNKINQKINDIIQ